MLRDKENAAMHAAIARAERAEAERDALRAENERLRGLLFQIGQSEARGVDWHAKIVAALSKTGRHVE